MVMATQTTGTDVDQQDEPRPQLRPDPALTKKGDAGTGHGSDLPLLGGVPSSPEVAAAGRW